MWYPEDQERSLSVLFKHGTVEALRMRWFKKDGWRVGIAVASILLLLVLVVWVPVSAAGAYEGASGLATPGTGTVQATPTEDATVTALNKEKFVLEIQQLKNQNDRSPATWLWTFDPALVALVGAILALFGVLATITFDPALVALVGAILALFGVLATITFNAQKDLKDRRDARKKQAEERFKSVVEWFGSEKEEAKVGAAIMLRTFLGPDYEQFHKQAFDLAVAHLRFPRTSKPPEDPDAALPLTSLSQALIAVFTEAFPLVRDELRKGQKEQPFNPQSLDATRIQLDKAFLWKADKADLEQVWMAWASLRGTDLTEAKLSGAALWGADFRKAKLRKADLRKADLSGADLREADLSEADLSGAYLGGKAKLSGADLSGADLSGVRELEDALSLNDTDLRGVTGLMPEQLKACKEKGAIIDEDM